MITLRLKRKPDPVLDNDEIRFLQNLCEAHMSWVDHEMSKGLVSESVIRTEMYAESCIKKFKEALQ